MSNTLFIKNLSEICRCLIKEGIRYCFSILRSTGDLSQEVNSVKRRLNKIRDDLNELEQGHNVKDFSFRQKMPPFRSLDETLDSTPDELTYLLGGLMIQGGTYVLFAHKGQGKSTFAMQIGLALARGEDIKLFSEYNKSTGNSPLDVIYLDYELSNAQIKERYHGVNSQNLHWMGTCKSSDTSECMKLSEVYLKQISKGKNAVLIIDNLSKIGGGYIQPTEAKELYAELDGLKSRQKEKYGRILTIILITHTQKDAKSGKPITPNDYSGAQDIIISADGVFAIGPTEFGNDTKLFKVLNNRNSIEPNNVAVIKHVNKPYSHFVFVAEMSETEALTGKATSNHQSPDKKLKYHRLNNSQVEDMKAMTGMIDPNTGKKYRQNDIAKKYNIPDSYVKRYLNGEMKTDPDPETKTEQED